PHKKTVKFRTYEFKSNIGDSFYIFSDGYIDQIGGPEQKTFRSKQFKELLQSIQHQNMTEQKKTLSARFKAWKGKTEQIDDILVMGIKI
ncbi:MAG: SpoIIE family protein phosphatase, partial [Bacteroidota bacterium]